MTPVATSGYCECQRSQWGYNVRQATEGIVSVSKVTVRVLLECQRPQRGIMWVSEVTVYYVSDTGQVRILCGWQKSQWGYYVSSSGHIEDIILVSEHSRVLCVWGNSEDVILVL